jgi:hypothetical protein
MELVPHGHDIKSNNTDSAKIQRPPSMPSRLNAARPNLDEFKIEQVACRRIRYVLDSKQATKDHLGLCELLLKRQS